MQPVLQHQEQSQLWRQEGVLGSQSPPSNPSCLPLPCSSVGPSPCPAHMPAGLVVASLQVALHLDHLGTGWTKVTHEGLASATGGKCRGRLGAPKGR